MRKIALLFLIFQLLLLPLEPVLAQEFLDEQVVEKQSAVEQTSTPHYPSLMRSVSATPADPASAADSLSSLITAEKDRLDAEAISFLRQHRYLKRLRSQLRSVNPDPSLWDTVVIKFTEWFSSEDSEGKQDGQDGSTPIEHEVKIPRKPAVFGFPNADIPVRHLSDPLITPAPGQTIPQKLKDLISIPEVNAIDDQFLPVYEDITPDNAEIVISSEIKQLASDLDYNPLSITNFVRSRTAFEPYYGAKKGAVGCLRETICNDTDSASLTVALLRAAGIPARYKKTIAVFPVDQLKNLLGVQDTKAVYAAFAFNHVPIFTISGNPDAGLNLDEADLSQETHLAIEWTHTEAFYDYDQRGGDISNAQDLSTIQNTDDLRALLRNEHKKQWIPIDTIIKPYTRVEEDILADTANFDTEAFWYNYFQYLGNLSPLEKYQADLLQATGRDIQDNLSTHTHQALSHTILPPTLPYLTGEGATPEGVNIQTESWSVLPSARRQQVMLTLTQDDNDNTVVFRHTFFASDINNIPITLSYEGETEQDTSIIEDRGGIHQTPAELVRIIPYLATDFAIYRGIDNNPSLSIGEPLVLQFDYIVNNNSIHTDQKFSIAGNHEGIFITLSTIQDNPTLDNEEDQNRTSKILLEGNTAIARDYLKTILQDGQTLAQSLDYSYTIQFARAVVTQNRVLSEFDGIPTTFDFKGLSIDSGVYIADYSNRENYQNHQKDFRLLFGLNASYQEGQTLANLTGLNSIATTQGLQYAYDNPNDYTVHRITQENEADIDNLNLSDNTKANLREDIRNGNTVLTPDRPITLGNFTGILYVSLDPQWTGRYAIGEQVGNGGWTVDDMMLASFFDNFLQRIIEYKHVEVNSNRISYQDDQEVGGVLCKVSEVRHNELTGRPDWEEAYGFPCMEDTVHFGSVQHSYILASNAIKLFSPDSYNYWAYNSSIKNTINNYISDQRALPDNHLNHLEDGSKYRYRFSTALGTYLQSICENDGWWNCADYATVYYSPRSDGGVAYRARANILDKLAENSNKAITRVGFPRSDEEYAADSESIQGGVYQDFMAGQVYAYSSWGFTKTYYTYDILYEVHNGNGGSGGVLGFPKSDPREANNFAYQEFEGDREIEWNKLTGVAQVVSFRKYRCELYGHIEDPARLGLITAHGIWDTGVQTLDDFGSLIGGALDKVLHPVQTTKELQELVEAAGQIAVNDVKEFLSETGGAAYDALLVELDNSFGQNGCEARSSYITGRVAGEVLLIYVPASKLKAAEKIQTLNHAAKSSKGIKTVALVARWFEYRSDVIKWIARLPDTKKARFYRDTNYNALHHVLLGKFNSASGKFQGGGLHSARTLKKGMDEGVLEVWDANKAIKYNDFADIPVDANGIRRVTIKKTTVFSPTKTLFPEEWSDDDIVDAMIEAADHGFPHSVTKNGKTVQVQGFLEDGLISSAFPNQ